ncbi:MAG: hypothetical protein NZ518_04745, partial [Dehalococcoidia bacterium]|nr:hypothetical protein [Dehalococcoidia bacterium]
LPRRYPIDPARLFVLGFSQGAVMAASLCLTDARRFRGAALLSGRLPPVDKLSLAVAALAGFPVFVGHGAFDPLIPVDAAYATQAYFAGHGADVTCRITPAAHQITVETIDAINAWMAPLLLPQPG